MLARLAFTCVVFVPGAAAQRIWIVDSANSPGTHFRDLPAALAAATDGDLIRLMGRDYSLPSYTLAPITRGISIVADPSTGYQPYGYGTLVVSGLAAGRQVLVKDLLCRNVSLTNNQGRVLLDQISSGSVQISACAQVQMNRCTMWGDAPDYFTAAPAATINGASVAMTDCECRGVDAWRGPWRLGPSSLAITASNSVLTLARCTVTGGNGGIYVNSFPDCPALAASSCRLRIAASASNLRSGQLMASPVSAIATMLGGSVMIDPLVPLLAAGGAPAISGNATVVVTRLPALMAVSPLPGGNLVAELESPPGELVAFFASRSWDPLALPGLGDLWLDPSRFVFAGAGVQGPGAHFWLVLPMTRDPLLASQAWTLQALTASSGGSLLLSNPAGCGMY